MLVAATRLFRGAGYAAFAGKPPADTGHAALAGDYAHVTAPLRRLADRYAGEICLAHCAGTAVPDWVAGIDSSTLVVIDEAGMADTLSLDAAVSYISARGGSVRLVGDDQQLSAIGAGGVLRDIVCNEVPMVFRDGKPYAICAFFGCWLYILLRQVDAGEDVALWSSATTITVLRLVTWKFDLRVGRP